MWNARVPGGRPVSVAVICTAPSRCSRSASPICLPVASLMSAVALALLVFTLLAGAPVACAWLGAAPPSPTTPASRTPAILKPFMCRLLLPSSSILHVRCQRRLCTLYHQTRLGLSRVGCDHGGRDGPPCQHRLPDRPAARGLRPAGRRGRAPRLRRGVRLQRHAVPARVAAAARDREGHAPGG